MNHSPRVGLWLDFLGMVITFMFTIGFYSVIAQW